MGEQVLEDAVHIVAPDVEEVEVAARVGRERPLFRERRQGLERESLEALDSCPRFSHASPMLPASTALASREPPSASPATAEPWFSSRSATHHTNRAKTTTAKATSVHARESQPPLFADGTVGIVGTGRVDGGDRSLMAEDDSGGTVGSTVGAATVNGIGSMDARRRSRRRRVGFAAPRAWAAVLDSLRW